MHPAIAFVVGPLEPSQRFLFLVQSRIDHGHRIGWLTLLFENRSMTVPNFRQPSWPPGQPPALPEPRCSSSLTQGGWPEFRFLELFLTAPRSQRIPLVYFVEVISDECVLRVPCPPVLGGRALMCPMPKGLRRYYGQ